MTGWEHARAPGSWGDPVRGIPTLLDAIQAEEHHEPGPLPPFGPGPHLLAGNPPPLHLAGKGKGARGKVLVGGFLELPVGPERHLDAARQFLSLNCLAITLTAGVILKEEKVLYCGGRGNLGGILRDNLGEGTCESKIAARQWGVNFCREASRCLAGPSRLWAPVWAWEYHEPGSPNEPGPLALTGSYLFDAVGAPGLGYALYL